MASSVDRTKSWLPEIRKARNDTSVTERQYPDWFVLTLIHIESEGDESAHDEERGDPPKPSQYYGLLQIGIKNAADFKRENTDFDGNGALSLRHFFQYLERYNASHNYNPELMATVWNAGADTARQYRRLLEDGQPEEAQEFLEGRWGGGPARYLVKFRRNRKYFIGSNTVVDESPNILPVSGERVASGSSSGPTTARGGGTPGCRTSAALGASRIADSSKQQLDKATRATQKYIQSNYGTAAKGFVDPAMASNRDPAQAGVPRRIQYIDNEEALKSFYLLFNQEPGRDFVWPLETINPRHGFAEKRTTAVGGGQNPKNLGVDPKTGRPRTRYHKGVDLDTRNDPNQGVYAMAAGTVVRAGISTSYGRVVYIEHENGISTRYAHLSELFVSVGQAFTREDIGTASGVVGRAGTSEGKKVNGKIVADDDGLKIPHLHFEIRVNRGVIGGGASKGSIRSNNANFPIDPVAMLQGALRPQEVREFVPAQTQAIADARENFGNLMLQAETEEGMRAAASAYDQYSAIFRAEAYLNAGRSTYWDLEASQNVQRQRQITSVTVLRQSDLEARELSSQENKPLGATPPDDIARTPTGSG